MRRRGAVRGRPWLLAPLIAIAIVVPGSAAGTTAMMARSGSDPGAELDGFLPTQDEVLAPLMEPAMLEAVPVGPENVADPVRNVLSSGQVIDALRQSGIPELAVRAYMRAANRLAIDDPSCGIRWTLLAAIGRVESNHSRFGGAQLRDDGYSTKPIRGIPLDGRPNVARILDTDDGALDGDTTFYRAVGPMQFIPSTWREVGQDGNGDGRKDPDNLFDAALGAAVYLCAGDADLRLPEQQAQAVRRYNNADEYVRVVLNLAAMYESGRVEMLPPIGMPPRAPIPPPRPSPFRPSPGPSPTPSSGGSGAPTPPPASPASPPAVTPGPTPPAPNRPPATPTPRPTAPAPSTTPPTTAPAPPTTTTTVPPTTVPPTTAPPTTVPPTTVPPTTAPPTTVPPTTVPTTPDSTPSTTVPATPSTTVPADGAPVLGEHDPDTVAVVGRRPCGRSSWRSSRSRRPRRPHPADDPFLAPKWLPSNQFGARNRPNGRGQPVRIAVES